MKVDNNADPRDFLFPMTEKKKNPQPPQVFSSSCPCVPLAAKKTPKKQSFWPTQH